MKVHHIQVHETEILSVYFRKKRMLSNFALSAEKEDKKKSDKYLLKILGLCEKKKKQKTSKSHL